MVSFPTFANVHSFKLSWGLFDVNEGLVGFVLVMFVFKCITVSYIAVCICNLHMEDRQFVKEVSTMCFC